MNKIILNKGEYSFDSVNGVVTIYSHLELLNKEYLLLITNTTTNIIIYNFACDGYGGVISSSDIDLEFNTSNMDDSDSLQIVLYTDESNEDINLKLSTSNILLECLNNILDEQKLTNKLLKKIYN